MAVFFVFVGVVAFGYEAPQAVTAAQQANVSDLATVAIKDQNKAPSVDEIIATDVAARLTERANLPIASNVANTAVSLSAQSELAQTNDNIISKPQIIQPTSGNRSITIYTTKPGDTVKSVAAKFSLVPNTVSWSNNLEFDALTAGRKLIILPTDGIRYKVRSGDTVNSIASAYHASVERITSYNDLELSGVTPGQTIIIPDGILPDNQRPGYVAPATANYYSGRASVIDSAYAGASAGNRYAWGNCTWYAYERRKQLGLPVGSFWGNANTWDDYARAAGYTVNNNPTSGAVLVDNSGYFGHVAIVESVKGNGDIVVSEMNNYAYGGYGIVDSRTISAGQARVYLYIH